MSLQSNDQNDEPVAPTWGAATPKAACGRFFRATVVFVALIVGGMLGAACGGSSDHGVASLGKATTTAGPSRVPGGSAANPSTRALAFVQCMRAHGDTKMADPVVSGHRVQIRVDPKDPHFTAAYDACRHLLPDNGVSKNTITPADQSDYIKAAACMRSHGVPDFPDPVFHGGSVGFQSRLRINTSSPQYKSALAICQKLIPKGLPYSSTGRS